MVRRVCNALPKSQLDRQFGSLPRAQRLLVLVLTAVVVFTVPPRLVEASNVPGVTVALGFCTLVALITGLAWYNDR